VELVELAVEQLVELAEHLVEESQEIELNNKAINTNN
jgi:hypothetical protein